MQGGRLIKMAEQTERGCFRLVLDEAAELDSDGLEDGLLRTCYPALRDALAQHLEGAIKKALAQPDQRGAGHRLRWHGSDYRVDGEVGRFTFALFDVIEADERGVFEGRCLLPSRQGRQWYQRWGFKGLALLDGAAQPPPEGEGAQPLAAPACRWHAVEHARRRC
jgi:hypothetical protein